MTKETNVFGQRICIQEKCPAYHCSDDYGEMCAARLDHIGRIKMVDGRVQYGQLCKLPIGFGIVRREDVI